MRDYDRLVQYARRHNFECICSTETAELFEEGYPSILVQEFDGRYFRLYLKNGRVEITQSC